MNILVPGKSTSGAERDEHGASLRGASVVRPLRYRAPDAACVSVEHNAARGHLRAVLAAMRKRRIIGEQYVGFKGTAAPEVVALINEWSGLPFRVEYLNDLSADELERAILNLRAHYLGE